VFIFSLGSVRDHSVYANNINNNNNNNNILHPWEFSTEGFKIIIISFFLKIIITFLTVVFNLSEPLLPGI